MTGSPPDIEALDLDGLKRLVLQLLEKVTSLKVENAALGDAATRPLPGLQIIMGLSVRIYPLGCIGTAR